MIENQVRRWGNVSRRKSSGIEKDTSLSCVVQVPTGLRHAKKTLPSHQVSDNLFLGLSFSRRECATNCGAACSVGCCSSHQMLVLQFHSVLELLRWCESLMGFTVSSRYDPNCGQRPNR